MTNTESLNMMNHLDFSEDYLESCVCVVCIQGLQVHSLNIGWSYLLPLSPPLLAAQVDQVAANHDADLGHKISSEPKQNFLQTLL